LERERDRSRETSFIVFGTPIFDARNRERGVELEFRIREGSGDSEREEKWRTYFTCLAKSAPAAGRKGFSRSRDEQRSGVEGEVE